MNKIEEFLLQNGFSKHEPPVQEFGEKVLFQRRLLNVKPVCALNEKIHMNVRIYRQFVGHKIYESAEAELTAQQQDQDWFKAAVYSLSFDDVIEKLDRIEKKLVRAWVAANKGI